MVGVLAVVVAEFIVLVTIVVGIIVGSIWGFNASMWFFGVFVLLCIIHDVWLTIKEEKEVKLSFA